MRLFVAVTDNDWFSLHASKPAVEEVNFWRPSPEAKFKALQPGEISDDSQSASTFSRQIEDFTYFFPHRCCRLMLSMLETFLLKKRRTYEFQDGYSSPRPKP
jgi:hypothetical protein